MTDVPRSTTSAHARRGESTTAPDTGVSRPPAAAPIGADATGHDPALRRSAWTHRATRPFVVLGAIGVVGGGLLSAAMAGAPSYHASWAVAYIVLIPGVAQLVLGVAQTALTDGALRGSTITAEVICWNLGNAAVVAGTLAGIPAVLYLGDALILATLAVILAAVRHARRGPILATTWVVAAILVVGVPVGSIIQAITG